MDVQKCDVCRLCLGSMNGCDEILLNNNAYLINSIFLITGLEVVSDPGQCEYVCNQCLSVLEQCVEFRETCISNDGVFREMGTSLTNIEDCEFEFEELIAPHIKPEPIYLEEAVDHVGEELGTNHMVYEVDEPSDKRKRLSKEEKDDNEWLPKAKRVRKKYPCKNCGQRFITAKKRLNHQRSAHSTTRSFACELCGSLFKTRMELSSHIRLHTQNNQKAVGDTSPQKKWKSNKNNDNGTELRLPRDANDTFDDIPKIKCEQCGIMMRHYNVKKHQQTHDPDRERFGCPHCPKEYLEVIQLKRHINAKHTRESQFKCVECGKIYVSRYSLNEHYSAMHRGEKRYPCPDCDEKFTRASLRSNHRRTVHA